MSPDEGNEKIEYSDTCPKCLIKMVETRKRDKENIFYRCRKCKETYRVGVVYQPTKLDCPYCGKSMLISHYYLSMLYFSSNLNLEIRKRMVK